MTGLILGVLLGMPGVILAAFVVLVAATVSFSARTASVAEVDASRDRDFRIAHPPQAWAAP